MAETQTIVDSGKPHPYHLVNPSPWPILASISAFCLTLGGVFAMHDGSPILLWIGLLGVLGCMVGWWRDILHESVAEKAHSRIVKIGLRYGMILFISSEVMLFVAFFWAFFNAALFPYAFTGSEIELFRNTADYEGTWPPPGIKPFDPFHLPLMMTFVLLLSGTTVTWAHHALREGHNQEAAKALAITVGLGVLFSFLQAYEYGHAAFGMGDGIYPSVFFIATGFHGAHVIIGTIFLAVMWWRTVKNHFTPDSHFGFEAAAWYWHFVDVVWLFLFVAIYWWGAGDASFY